MRTRTPGQRWFDAPAVDFPRRCGEVATRRTWAQYARGVPLEEIEPQYSSVVDAVNALTREARS